MSTTNADARNAVQPRTVPQPAGPVTRGATSGARRARSNQIPRFRFALMLSFATVLFALLACSDDVTGPSGPASAPAGEISASVTGITIFAEGFESGSLAVWDDRGGKDRHRILTNSSLARSGSRVLEITYPKGGHGGWLTKFFMPGYDSLYVSYYVRLEDKWEGSTKLLGVRGSHVKDKWSAFGKAGICPTGWDHFSTGVITEAPDRGKKVNFYTYYPEMRRESDGKCWGRYGDGTVSYSSSRTLTPGKWHRIEFWIKLNTPGQKNAIQKFWIDGELRGEWSGISLRKTKDLKLNSVMINASARSPRTQRMYVDDMVVKVGGPPR